MLVIVQVGNERRAQYHYVLGPQGLYTGTGAARRCIGAQWRVQGCTCARTEVEPETAVQRAGGESAVWNRTPVPVSDSGACFRPSCGGGRVED